MKAEKFIKDYLQNFKKHKDAWNYEDGCILMGCVQLYQVTGDGFYQQTVLNYLDDFIREDGTINNYEKEKYNIDNINSGKVLFYAYEWTKEKKYLSAIEHLMEQLTEHPRTKSGNFWHKKIYPNQIWLDGLYMAQPFYMMYETRYHKKENYADIITQFQNVRKYMFNEEKSLYYHGYDETKSIFWANKETGNSPNFWLRSMGWYLMALIDVMDEMDEAIFEQYMVLEELFREAVRGILKYQDKDSNLFYQVIDHPEEKGNYLETSGSVMVAYAIIKGCLLGALLKEKYLQRGLDILDAITDKMLIEENGRLTLSRNCAVAGLGPEGDTRRDGSVAYYLSEPVICNDHKGIGAYIMAYAEQLKVRNGGTYGY